MSEQKESVSDAAAVSRKDSKGQPQPDTSVYRRVCPFCGRKVMSDLNFCPYCGHSLHTSGHIPEAISGGKEKCEQLRKIRKTIAAANDIPYEPAVCFHEGPCAGSCPVCDGEIQYLDEQLEQKRARGEEVRLAALAADAVRPFTGGDGGFDLPSPPPPPPLAGISAPPMDSFEKDPPLPEMPKAPGTHLEKDIPLPGIPAAPLVPFEEELPLPGIPASPMVPFEEKEEKKSGPLEKLKQKLWGFGKTDAGNSGTE